MKRLVWIFAAGWLLLLMASCKRDEIQEETPRLHAITVFTSEVAVPQGGNASLTFNVRDAEFEFQYNPLEEDCQLVLLLSSGTEPSDLAIQACIKRGDGVFEAVIAHTGAKSDYSVSASIAIRLFNDGTGQYSYVSSSAFTISVEEELIPDNAPDYMKTGLPVVYVNTAGGAAIVSKTDDVEATFSVTGRGGYPGMDAVSCRVRGRGNTTWTWPKKPYLVKLDERAAVLGMKEHKRWVLLANFMDRTLMRNIVSMYVATLTSLEWTPSCVPVELVLNGEHMGNYLVIEQVRVDKNRIDIERMKNTDNTGDALTGGYLLELDFHYDNPVQWKDHGIPFSVKYPESEDITPQQKTYIKNYIAEVSNAIYGDSFKDPEKGYAAYLDVDSFIDYWIVYEVMCNHELGNPGSVFFHKDRGGKLVAGPCWDFDWGVLSFYTSRGDVSLVNGGAIWYSRLRQDPAFEQRLKQRYQQLRPFLESVPEKMEEMRKHLSKSAALNFAMWNPADDRSQNGGNIINGDETLTFDAAVDRLKSNYLKHLSVIDSKL